MSKQSKDSSTPVRQRTTLRSRSKAQRATTSSSERGDTETAVAPAVAGDQVQCVDIGGQVCSHPTTEVSTVDQTDVVAKAYGAGVYMVRASADGVLFNPAEGDRLSDRDRERSGAKFRLRRCGSVCFECYVRYLQNRQRPDFNIAQREFLNGH